MTAPTHLHRVGPGLQVGPGSGRLAYGVGERFEIVTGRTERLWVRSESDDLPAAGCGEALGMRLTKVVAVRLGVRRKGTEHGGLVGVDVGERRDGGSRAGRARASADGTHEGTI
jgi:hypothetical protein